ncbi:MAG TPA: M13 family metallopeptidase N-terminal domain-containing protein, partial [Terriglobales bacterium]|nr:M13 family metallopeptidase N-terminal domain-containing protein [Terriglobales bacterium]
MRTSKLAIFFVSLFVLLSPYTSNAQQASTEEVPKLEHFNPDSIDKTLDPCQDFYKYVCSKWNAANPIPPDQVAWGTSSGLRYWNENILRETLVKASAQTSGGSDFEQKIGDYWGACMNEPALETAGTRDLKPEVQRIDGMKSKSELADQVAKIHMMIPGAWQGDDNQTGVALLGFGSQQDFDDAGRVVAGIDQGGLGLPNRDFYLKDDPTSKQIREKYQTHIAKMLTLTGETETQAAADAKIVVTIETEMAKAQMDNVARRDPKNLNNKMSFEEVQALTPSFDWKEYVTQIGAPPSTPHYLVTSPAFFKGLEQLIQQHSVEDWKAYLRWHLVHGSAPYLNKALADENWDFYSHTLLGSKAQQPRWRRCVRAADRDLGMALGEAYVKVAFPPSSKERTLGLVHDVEHALDQDITSLNWMQPATKEQAETKLRAIEDNIGYPNRWRDYSSVRITRDSYLNNVHEA